ncbi:hypothetical protein NP493_358g05013 [Ridgeia piscesae]|uniref:Neurotransmitter-gated ion-channel ligand-binding domain-containing protein n=1 Tax=Ridgeia piscesae TaxID=27915 RepID=A0AAD9NVF6_RIDPI|nr:hypothetical protein NP493_358g05013 [Ridgeia piscesae]
MSCLLHSYDRAVRPATADGGVVTVDFEMKLLHVMELSTKTGVLRAQGWLEKSWIDPQLTWNPSDYESSITNIRIPAKKIWTPDIVQYHNVGDHDLSTMDVKAVVNSNGTVTWSTFIKLAARCHELMGGFPMDYHHCVIVFGSWTYNHTQVIVNDTNIFILQNCITHSIFLVVLT